MPAYDRNNWFSLFFIVYVILCLYIFMSIVLAAIYNNYRRNLKVYKLSIIFVVTAYLFCHFIGTAIKDVKFFLELLIVNRIIPFTHIVPAAATRSLLAQTNLVWATGWVGVSIK